MSTQRPSSDVVHLPFTVSERLFLTDCRYFDTETSVRTTDGLSDVLSLVEIEPPLLHERIRSRHLPHIHTHTPSGRVDSRTCMNLAYTYVETRMYNLPLRAHVHTCHMSTHRYSYV